MEKNVVSENILKLRKREGLTQQELAEKLEVSDKTISRWERGERIPKRSQLRKISSVFGVSIEQLEEKEELKQENNDIPLNCQKNKKKNIVIICISVVLFCLLISYFIFAIYVKNNFNQFQIYRISSNNRNNQVEGMVVVTPENDTLVLNSVSINDERLLEERIYAIYYELEINGKIIEGKGTNIDNYEYNPYDETLYLYDATKQISLNFSERHDYNERIDALLETNNGKIIIKYVSKDLEKKELIINLSVERVQSNNKLFYKKSSEIW